MANSNISIIPIPPFPQRFQTTDRRLFIVYGPLKVLFQIWSLWQILGYRTKPAKWLLVQVCLTRRMKSLILD